MPVTNLPLILPSPEEPLVVPLPLPLPVPVPDRFPETTPDPAPPPTLEMALLMAALIIGELLDRTLRAIASVSFLLGLFPLDDVVLSSGAVEESSPRPAYLILLLSS
ncbi:unnamed protein product [Ambrosiozyma monospora]|uniref:Unnamed protein product n=1 Tax=Ambrosiozyma monospora TaxID=43982 RepID=A0A9W6YTP1_AMBMO|nr:unnamed protein product [Ambrosiozyma monospora]